MGESPRTYVERRCVVGDIPAFAGLPVLATGELEAEKHRLMGRIARGLVYLRIDPSEGPTAGDFGWWECEACGNRRGRHRRGCPTGADCERLAALARDAGHRMPDVWEP